MDTLHKMFHTLNHLTVDQMLELVKKSDNRTDRKFRATGPTGSMEGIILDPFLGMIQFDGDDGFVMASSFRFANDITWKLI